MESGFSSILPLIPRKTAYPFKNTIIKFKRIIPKNKMIFMLIFPFYCQFRLCITTALFRAAAKADAGKAPDCVKSHCPNLARCCPQPLEGEFYEKTA